MIRFEHLSEAQKRAYLIADNQLALQAGWSEELLAQELAWLRDENFDLDLVGFDATELERLLAIAGGEIGPDDAEDEVPRRAARSSTRASCSRSTAGGSAQSTSPTRARLTSSRSACPGCSASTMRRRTSSRPPTPSACRRYAKQAVDQQFARWVMLHGAVEPLADLHPAACADQCSPS